MNKLAKSILFIITSTLVFGTLPGGTCFGSTNGNGEYWQTLGFDVDMNIDWKITFRQELRFGKSGGDPYLHNYDLGLVRKNFADRIDVGLNFKKEYEKDSSGKFRAENRPNLNIMLKGKLFCLDVSDRLRLEYRNIENKKDLWRFRNKTVLNLPFKLTMFNLQPYIADEIFINLGENNINQNRLFSGLSFKLSPNIKSSIYYMYKSSKQTGGWLNTNVIGTADRMAFLSPATLPSWAQPKDMQDSIAKRFQNFASLYPKNSCLSCTSW